MANRVLITGSGGFTGRYVHDEFMRAGWEVWGASAQSDPKHARFLKIDLHNPVTLAPIADTVKPEVVIHLAATAFIGHGNPSDFYSTNTLGTRNLLDALDKATHRPRCIILASSANVYGNRVEGKLNESTLPDPVNDYAVSKLAMEYVARLWFERLPIVIVRPFNYTGVGQSLDFLIPKIVAHMRAEKPFIELGNLDVSRDFSDVRDIARYYYSLAECAPNGETINLCSGQLHTLRDIIAQASDITGHAIEVRVNPALVRRDEVRKLCGDSGKLHQLIGVSETIPLADTLRWMLTS
ncbi:MAG: GDP-mannose 4,6-dehydratase [Proteobacteria bacterium]|jgi:nucleoside-diphosphate-sugar epimerase|nr:GDP-mannose 4,6-dehydratase [Pseudomonadota bacterium]